jgi:hypothetical protein
MRSPTHRLVRRTLTAATAVLLVLTGSAQVTTSPVAAAPTGAAAPQQSVLVFHGEAAEQDDPVAKAAATIDALADTAGLTTVESTDPAVFTPAGLAPHRAVVFLSTAGTVLTRDQEGALQSYIKAGGGFVGIADAAKAQLDSTWFTGLIGTRPAGSIPASEPVAKVTASGENPPNETKEKLTDGDTATKWLVRTATGWVTYELAAAKAITGYALTSANDFPGRDPKDWTLRASADGQTWTDVDRRTGQAFPDRFQTRRFDLSAPQDFRFFRLEITANNGEPLIQLANLRLFTADAVTPPPPGVNQAVVDVLDTRHPATAGLPRTVTRSDRWYNWDPNPLGSVHTLAQVEERHYNAGTSANGPFHPVSWCRDYDGGRSFYTGMGHTAGSYDEDAFRKHLTGALKWASGIVRGDCQAGIAANYRTERLTAANQTGQLDQVGEPHGLTIAADGTVFYVGKAACPSGPVVSWDDPKVGLGCGTIHSWNPRTRQVKLLTTLPVMGNRGSGTELVKNEEGLLGIVPDPKFAENGWLYVYWMPHDSVDRAKRVGQRTVSRFTYDAQAQTIDQATRKDLLQFPVQIHSCCHAGGGMAFDKRGNLYIGSGDNNSSEGSQHQRPGREDHPHPPGGGRHLHHPPGQPVPAGHRENPPGDLRDGRTQHRPPPDRPGDRLADRRLGRPRRHEPEPGTGPGEIRDGHHHHLRRKPGLAVLHGQPAAVPRPQQHRRHRPDRLVRLRQPEEHLTAQHRPDRHPAGPRQHDLVLPRWRRPGLPDPRRRQRPAQLRRRRRRLHPAVPARRWPGGDVRPDLPPRSGRPGQHREVAGVLGRQVVHRRPVERRQPGGGHRRPGRGAAAETAAVR